jgi:hypothetical protein
MIQLWRLWAAWLLLAISGGATRAASWLLPAGGRMMV